MQDQPSTSDDQSEPPLPKNIPDDFIWDAEEQASFPAGEATDWDLEAFSRELDETIRKFREESIANGTWNNGTVIRLGPRPDRPQEIPTAMIRRKNFLDDLVNNLLLDRGYSVALKQHGETCSLEVLVIRKGLGDAQAAHYLERHVIDDSG